MLRRELAGRGGGGGAAGGDGQPPPASLQPQYYQQQSQEAGSSSQAQQNYAADDLPQGAVVQSPPYGNFYSAPPEAKPDLQHQHSGYQPMMIDPALQQNGFHGQGYSHARQSSSNGSMTPNGAGGEGSSQSSGVPGRDIGSLLNGVGFAGHESGEQKFMGSSSGSAFHRLPDLSSGPT